MTDFLRWLQTYRSWNKLLNTYSINCGLRSESCSRVFSRYKHFPNPSSPNYSGTRRLFSAGLGDTGENFRKIMKVPRLQQSYRCVSFWKKSKSDVKDWNKAVSEAEKIVGYPTSFMSLRCLLSDEFSNVAMHMRKLVGTTHPIMKTVRELLHDKRHSLQTRGLVVLLIAKAAGYGKVRDHQSDSVIDEEISGGITSSQRQLAEIVELIHTANLIHKGVVNLRDLTSTDDVIEDMELGNKMAVLSGDYLLANASVGLAELQNTQVVEIISGAIGDLMTAEFTGLTDDEGNGKLKSDVEFEDWEKQTFLSTGSLLAKSCRSALLLSDHPDSLRTKAFEFGLNLAYAQQLNEDVKPFLLPVEEVNNLNFGSAPIIHYIIAQGSKGFDALASVSHDVRKVFSIVKTSGVVSECEKLLHCYGDKAVDSLEQFPDSDAKTALKNIVKAVVRL